MPNFLLKLNKDDELVFNFTFIVRQDESGTNNDTQINGLTYVYASTSREVENLVTREFHADPNLHKNANVELVGDYNTGGSASISFEWSWKWKPPRPVEDRGGGWKNVCSVRIIPGWSSLEPCAYADSPTVCRVRRESSPARHTRHLLLLGC